MINNKFSECKLCNGKKFIIGCCLTCEGCLSKIVTGLECTKCNILGFIKNKCIHRIISGEMNCGICDDLITCNGCRGLKLICKICDNTNEQKQVCPECILNS